jgi:ribosomal protein S18 acetylase RimI-like enzyme
LIAARPALAHELPEVIAITEQAYAPYVPVLGGKPLPMTEDYAPRIARGEVWLVSRDASIAGLMLIEDRADHLSIFSLAVLPAAQHRGLGQWMLGHAEALARDRAVASLRLYTNALMTRNIGLYRRFGFRDAGERANPYRPGWRVLDMEKPVTPRDGRT